MIETNYYNNNPLLPRAFKNREYTQWEKEEFQKCYEDIVYFADNYFYALNSNTGIIGKIKLYDYQLEALEKFRDLGRMVMLTSRQAGKAIDLNTDIPMFDGGFKKMADIRVGDKLIGSNGKPTNVTFISQDHNKPTYRVTFDDKSSVIVCEDHIWTVGDRCKPKTKNMIDITTKEMADTFKKSKREFRYFVKNINPVDYQKKELPIDPYILGAWLGDGTSACGNFTCNEEHLQHYINQGMQVTSARFKSLKRNPNTKDVTVVIPKLTSKLKHLNLINNKHIPDIYLFSCLEDRIRLLQGIIDTDGYVDKIGRVEIGFCRKYPKLLDSLKTLVASLGIKYFCHTRYNKTYNSYSDSITFSIALDQFQPCTIPFKLDRIKHQLTHTDYVLSRTIQKIELIETHTTRCLTVDADDHLFAITKNYILTHNTTVASVIILHTALFNKDKMLALLANFQSTAIEILDRIKEAFENLPDFLKQGILTWNRKTIKFENGCTIFANASKGSSIRGKTIYLLYVDECVGGDTLVTMRNKKTGEIFQVPIKALYDISIDDLEVLTENGFESFDGIKRSVVDRYMNIYFDDNTKILCTYNHRFLYNDEFIYADKLNIGDVLSNKKIINIEYVEENQEVFDLINVSNGNHYITEGVTSHNCAFVDNWTSFASSTLPSITANKESKVIYTSCVTDDTFVWTNKGLQQVKDFIDYNQIDHPNIGYNIPNYSVVGMNKLNHGNIMVNSGITKTKTITTTHSSLTGSMQHKLYACVNGVYGWYKLNQLSIGDYVSIRYGYNHWICNDDLSDIKLTHDNKRKNTFIVPDKMTTDISYILGYYLADGNASYHRSTLDISSEDSNELIQSLKRCNLPVITYDNIRHKVCCKDFVEFMVKYGFDIDKKSHNKVIPQRMTQSSPEIIKSFLRGLFDGDGSISLIRNRIQINLTSTSEMLINQVRMILQNFGILTHKYYKPPCVSNKVVGKHDVYVLEIYGQHADLFNNLIGFNIPRKKLKQNNTRSIKRTNGKDVIPHFFPLLKQHNIKLKSGQKRGKQTDCSRELALQYVGDRFPNICSEQIKWEKINDIQYGENKVYDFSLDDIEGDDWCHSVLYNGYIGHQTPNGLNHFYEYCRLAKEGKNGYGYIEVPWHRIEGRDEKWKENTLRDINYNYEEFESEYNCQFLGSSGTLISGAALKLLEKSPPVYTHDNLKIYEKFNKDHNYVMVVDSSKGVGLDYHAFSVFDITTIPYKQVAAFRDNQMSPYDYSDLINNVGKMYNNAYILIELNCPSGAIVAERLFWQHEYENILMSSTDGRSGRKISSGFGGGKVDRGIYTSTVVKSVGCSMLKLLIEQQQLIINDENTIDELKTFSKKGKSYEAEEGKHDDLVMGLVLFAWLTNQDYFKQISENDVSDHLKTKTDQDIDDYVNGLGIMVVSNSNEEEYEELYNNSFYIPY